MEIKDRGRSVFLLTDHTHLPNIVCFTHVRMFFRPHWLKKKKFPCHRLAVHAFLLNLNITKSCLGVSRTTQIWIAEFWVTFKWLLQDFSICQWQLYDEVGFKIKSIHSQIMSILQDWRDSSRWARRRIHLLLDSGCDDLIVWHYLVASFFFSGPGWVWFQPIWVSSGIRPRQAHVLEK